MMARPGGGNKGATPLYRQLSRIRLQNPMSHNGLQGGLSPVCTPPADFEEHRWHSAQFRMNAAKQNKYWESIYREVK